MGFGGGAGFLGEQGGFGFVFDLVDERGSFVNIWQLVDCDLAEEGERERVLVSCVFTYCDFEIDHFVCERAHLIVEAEAVLARVLGCEDKISLSFFFAGEDYSVAWAVDYVVDVEGAS